MNKRVYLLTGAAGFLGNNIAQQLVQQGNAVRALVLPGDKAAGHLPPEVEIVYGDLTDISSLHTWFDTPAAEKVCIHCASMVYLKETPNEMVRKVNVDGTQNVIDLCLQYNAKKLVMVSSTGTIPDYPQGQKIAEPTAFDMEKIMGYYGKTKAMATQLVFDAVKNQGLDASVVYPSGICGPYDYAHGPVSTFIIQYCNGEMAMGFPGSFNSVDVRDLAAGTIACVDRGRKGEGYILANQVVSMQDMFRYISQASGAPLVKRVLPMPLARLFVRLSVLAGKITGKDPLMTDLMMYNLVRNNNYDSSKTRTELGYHTRPFQETICDEVLWLHKEKMITKPLPTATQNTPQGGN